jgi:hypothetical protein
MKFMRFIIFSLVLFLSACKSHEKKILVYANSQIQVDESQKNITVTDGNTQVEKELIFNSGSPVVLNITAPEGKYVLEAAEDGCYLANLKKDTVVGSLQHTGVVKQNRITQEQLKLQLDSLTKLVAGTNISPAAKNFFIAPGKMVKISEFTNVQVFGPFAQIPNDFDPSSAAEVFKFFNVSEVNKIISKLTEMSKYKYEKGEVTGKADDVNDDSVYTIHPTKK